MSAAILGAVARVAQPTASPGAVSLRLSEKVFIHLVLPISGPK